MADEHPVAAGRYRLYNALHTTVAMTVYNAGAKNGSNVCVYANGSAERDTSFADVWQLSYRADGTAQLINVYSGKSLDVASGKVSKGQNVQVYTDNDSRAQRWELVASATGKTVTISGTTYGTFFVALHADTDYVCDVSGSSAASGKNVQLYTRDSSEASTDQLWAFVPVPDVEDGGVFEFCSMANTTMRIGIANGSTTTGASAILWKTNSNNDQKWYGHRVSEEFTDSEGNVTPAIWEFRNIKSGRYLDCYNGTTVKSHVNQRLCQYDKNGTAAQQFYVQRYGSTKVNGRSCDLVALRSAMTATTATGYFADAYDALHTSSNVVVLEAARSASSQQWAMYPTTAEDPTMPIPVNVGMVRNVGDEDGKTQREADADRQLYPTWTCTDAWATSGPNHYEWRRRYRKMSPATSTWGGWSDWSDWSVAGVTVEGQRAWLTEGIPQGEYVFGWDEAKSVEWEFQVRAVGADETSVIHGTAADQVFTIAKVPTITLADTAGLSVDGLHIDFSSDYSAGTNVVNVRSVTDDTQGKDLLDTKRSFRDLDESSSIEVGFSTFTTWVEDGDEVSVTYSPGNDQVLEADGTVTKSGIKVSYDAGHGFDVGAEVSMGAGRMLKATANALATNTLWLVYDETPHEVGGILSEDGSTVSYSIPYPFDRNLSLWFDARSEDGDTWGTQRVTLDKGGDLLGRYEPCHAWNWGDANEGAFALECRADDPLETTRTLSATYEAYTLNGRRRQAVHFAKTIEGEFEAEGLLYRGLTSSTVDDLIALQEARHVTYRAPSGEVADVAITDIEYTTHGDFTSVKVNMIEETV